MLLNLWLGFSRGAEFLWPGSPNAAENSVAQINYLPVIFV